MTNPINEVLDEVTSQLELFLGDWRQCDHGDGEVELKLKLFGLVDTLRDAANEIASLGASGEFERMADEAERDEQRDISDGED